MHWPRTLQLPLRPASNPGFRSGRRRPLVSLTPLIDVVFILLIFFMLASSFLDWRAITLKAPAESGAGASVEGSILVEIRPDRLRLSGETLPLGALAAKVGERLAKAPDQPVLVKPAAGVSLQETVQILDRLTAVGAKNLSLIRDSGR